jgi:hypothetical protein
MSDKWPERHSRQRTGNVLEPNFRLAWFARFADSASFRPSDIAFRTLHPKPE